MLCKGRVRRDYISISYDHWAGKEAELISICALYRVDQKKVSFTRLWHGLKDTFFWDTLYFPFDIKEIQM